MCAATRYCRPRPRRANHAHGPRPSHADRPDRGRMLTTARAIRPHGRRTGRPPPPPAPSPNGLRPTAPASTPISGRATPAAPMTDQQGPEAMRAAERVANTGRSRCWEASPAPAQCLRLHNIGLHACLPPTAAAPHSVLWTRASAGFKNARRAPASKRTRATAL